jgi:3-oxoacyl-[acyl-carrier protein] reductase
MTNEPRRVAIVTGGARGIGASIAHGLASDGYAVGVLDLTSDAAEATAAGIRAAGGSAIAVGADVADADQVSAAVEQVAIELGAPVVLVNNAGVTRDNLLLRMTEDDWDLVVRVHLRGAFLMSRAVQSHMTAARWGRIVNISSQSALGNYGQANYAAAKAGLQGFTKTLALELGKFGVTVNAIAPGFIATDMTAATADRLGVGFEEYKQSVAETIPVRRVGHPDDISNAVSFLAGDAAGFVSGQVLYVAGGPVD